MRWLALLLALLQPLALAPALFAAGAACSADCCCAPAEPDADAAEPDAHAAERGGCCAPKAAAESGERARLSGECGCRLSSQDDAPAPERAPTPGSSATQGACEEHARGAAVSARSVAPLGVSERVPQLAHAPPGRLPDAPPGAPGPWKSLARRGVDALLAGLGVARL